MTSEVAPETAVGGASGEQASSSSTYTLAEEPSLFSREIDRWLGVTSVDNGLQMPRQDPRSQRLDQQQQHGFTSQGVQRSVMARPSLSTTSGIWYILALAVPLLNSCPQWRCTSSRVISTAQLMMTTVNQVCSRARQHLQTLAQDQVARDLFATAMDIVLVIYAMGFLILSMYQASIFG